MKPGKKDERKPDINGVDKAVEQHVDQMLDPTVPDVAPETPVAKTTAKKISVFHDNDDPGETPPTAPPVADKSAPKEPLKITIVDHQAEDAPEPEPAPKSAPAPVKKPIGITVVDNTDSGADVPATAPEVPIDVAADEEPVTPEVAPASEKTPEPEVDPEPTESDEPTPAEDLPDELDDPKLDKVVDDIIASESDQLLAAEDEKLARAFTKPERRSFGQGVADFFGGWWHNPITRWLTVLLILGSIGAAAYLPTTRYYALNTAGVRSGASVQVIDQSTFQPLKDVEVQLAGQTVLTNAEGRATFSKLRLGPTQLTIQKRAFAPVTESKVIGWGSNPFGRRNLSPVGSQYTFIVTDYLSGKPVAKVAASTG